MKPQIYGTPGHPPLKNSLPGGLGSRAKQGGSTMTNQKQPNLYEEVCRLTGNNSLTEAQIAQIVCYVLQVEGCLGQPDNTRPVGIA